MADALALGASATGVGVQVPSPAPEKKTGFDRNLSFSVIFALRRVILLRSDIRQKPSDIALWAVLAANIISLNM